MRRTLLAGLLAVGMAGGATLLAAPGYISTVVGIGAAGYAGDGEPADAARISTPRGLAFDAAGNLYLADSANHRIRRVDAASGVITTIAGTGTAGFNGDGLAATSRLNFPRGIAIDAAGHLFVADSRNHRIRRIDATTGSITTVAGTGVSGFNSDGILATGALIAEPGGLVIGPAGELIFAEISGARVRRVDADTGLISTVAGTGVAGFNGDLMAAGAAQLNTPMGVAVDDAGHVFIADTLNSRIRRMDATTGVITTVAGTGVFGYNGDGIPAVAAQVVTPASLLLDGAGHLFFSDQNAHRVRRVDAMTGLISTIAGTGVSNYNGDDQPAVNADLRVPDGLAVDAAGHLFIAESGGARVRRVESGPAAGNEDPLADVVLTLAGPVCGSSGGTLVKLDGSGSSDPDGDALSYTWTGPFPEGEGTVSGVSPVVTLPLGGPHVVVLVVSDESGAEASASAEITIVDTSSPLLTLVQQSVTVGADPGTMTSVDVLAETGATAADACDPHPTLVVHGPALFPRGSTTTVTIEASDAGGNAVSRDVEVTVLQSGAPQGPPGGRGKPDTAGPPAGKGPNQP